MPIAIKVGAVDLRRFARELLEAVKVAPDHAALVAESFVAANLRAVDSHGVQLLPALIERILGGDIVKDAIGYVVSESGSTLLYDGDNGLGQVVSATCAGHAVRLAREHGTGMVVARESSHFGAAAFWAKRISSEGMIGIVMCTASPSIAPWQGRDPRLGTNPICVSVPCRGRGEWLLDMATTTVARNRILKAAQDGEAKIPAGWAMDKRGVPTTSTAEAVTGLPMPLGGYKGSGLAVMVEILCAVLSGGALLTEAGGLHRPGGPGRASQLFLAIDVERFLPRAEFEQRMERLVAELKSSAPAEGYREVLVAGEPENRHEAVREPAGIPIDSGLWVRLSEYAKRFGVEMPR